MFIYNSLITNKDKKIELKFKKMKNHFQLKTGQVLGCIDNIKLTFLYLDEKRT